MLPKLSTDPGRPMASTFGAVGAVQFQADVRFFLVIVRPRAEVLRQRQRIDAIVVRPSDIRDVAARLSGSDDAAGQVSHGHVHDHGQPTLQCVPPDVSGPLYGTPALFSERCSLVTSYWLDGGQIVQANVGRIHVVQTLLHELRKKRSPTASAQTLRGLSNAGVASALDSVTPFLESHSEEVRAAALSALGAMKDSRVDTLIVQTLLTDPKKNVRRAAAEAASSRESSETLLTGLQNAVTADPDVKVRRQVLDTQISWLPDHPELKVALETVERQDERPSMKRAAREALEKHAFAPSAG